MKFPEYEITADAKKFCRLLDDLLRTIEQWNHVPLVAV